MASYYSQTVSTSKQASRDTVASMKSVAEQNLRTKEFEIDETKKFGQLGKSAADKYQNAMTAGSVLSGLITTGVTMTAPWAIGLALAGTYAAGKIGESRARKELGKSKYFGKTKSEMMRAYEQETKSTAITTATLAGFGSYAAKQAGGGPIEGQMTGIDWDKIKEAGASTKEIDIGKEYSSLQSKYAKSRAKDMSKLKPSKVSQVYKTQGGQYIAKPNMAMSKPLMSQRTVKAGQAVMDWETKNPELFKALQAAGKPGSLMQTVPKTSYAGMGKQFGKEILSNWADVYKGTAKLGASKADAFFNQGSQGQYLNPATASNVQPSNVASPYVSNRSWDPDLMTWN